MPCRILIADDNEWMRIALRQLLEGAGPWEIVEAENGQQALTKAVEARPNLIILDLVMPVMDGLTAAREISRTLPDIPLLMHTLHWSPQVELEAQKVGVRKVVPKPDSKGLIAAVQQLIPPEPPSPGVKMPEPATLSPETLNTIATPAPQPEATVQPAPLNDAKGAVEPDDAGGSRQVG